MRINLTRGMRRLVPVAIALAAIVGFVNAWNVHPQVWLTYQVQSPGAEPTRVERCGDDDAREYFFRENPQGTHFNIELCFKTVQKGELKFIPYATDEEGTSWIELKNSPQIASYTRTVARSFTLPEADQGAALALWQKEKARARLAGFGQLAIGLVALGLCYWLAGWIARRYLGFAPARQRPRDA